MGLYVDLRSGPGKDVSEAGDFGELKSMLAENERRRNAIIGKALGSWGSGDGTVMVLISLQ